MTTLKLAQYCKERQCKACSVHVKKECLQNDCWKAKNPYDRCCPAVYYGLIGERKINYEKITKHLQTCGWVNITDITVERNIKKALKTNPPFKSVTIFGKDYNGNQVAYTYKWEELK